MKVLNIMGSIDNDQIYKSLTYSHAFVSGCHGFPVNIEHIPTYYIIYTMVLLPEKGNLLYNITSERCLLELNLQSERFSFFPTIAY